MPTSNERIGSSEPMAATRQAAASLWGMFVALCQQGFTEEQAMILVSQALVVGMAGRDDGA